MESNSELIEFLKLHNHIEPFDYNLAVDWAIEMLLKGYNYKSLISIASLSKPVTREETSLHLTQALKDLNIAENSAFEEYLRKANYHTRMILKENDIRENLFLLYKLYLESEDSVLEVFFSLHHAWKDLETDFIKYEMNGVQMYYEGATLENIEEIVKMESKKWLKKIKQQS